MDLKEQNWKNLCANHLKDWHGIWTRYSHKGEVIESFQQNAKESHTIVRGCRSDNQEFGVGRNSRLP